VRLAAIADREKLIFTSVSSAKRALSRDSLGCVYRKADSVFVVTTFGTGTFTSAEWDASA
jgi:hypothetical protein